MDSYSRSALVLLIIAYTSLEGVLSQKNMIYVEPPYIMNWRFLLRESSYVEIECDYSKFRNIEIPPDAYAEWIGITRKVENQPEELFASYPPRMLKNVSGYEPRLFHGGSPGIFKDSGLNIHSTIFGINCVNVGGYKCVVKIRGQDQLVNSSTSYILAKPPFHENDDYACKGKKIVYRLPEWVDLEVNKQLKILCNNSRFWDVYVPPSEDIQQLSILRQLENNEIVEIASYFPKNPVSSNVILKEMKDRNPEFNKGGYGGPMDNEHIFLEMILNDARCEDAGTFRCMLVTAQSKTMVFSNKFYVDYNTKEFSMNNLKVSPNHGINGDISYNEKGEDITVECSFTGPRKVQPQWHAPGNAETFPLVTIKDAQVCPTYIHLSNCTYRLESNNTEFICRAVNGPVLVDSRKIRIFYSRVPPTILSVTRVYIKFNFTISCNASHFISSRFPPNSYIVAIGIMYRFMFKRQYATLAMYEPFTTGAERVKLNIPEGRKWEFVATGGEHQNNVQTINTIMYVYDGNCEDWGSYKCAAKTNLDPNFFYSERELISKIAKISRDDEVNCLPFEDFWWDNWKRGSRAGAMSIHRNWVVVTPGPMWLIIYELMF